MMAWFPLENIPRQWVDPTDNTVLDGYWLIAFEAGTTDRVDMATFSSGAGASAKFQTNSNGYLVTSGSVVITPYIDRPVKLALVPTEAEADASDITNSVWPTIDNVNGIVTSAGDSPWSLFSGTPTRTGNTTFTLTGDQTATFPVGTELRLTDATTIYGVVLSSAYTSVTTVTVLATANLSASLSAVYTAVSKDSGQATWLKLAPRTYVVNANLTINEDLKFVKGSKISVASGITLTINAYVEAGQFQIFEGSGTTTGAILGEVIPEWWGALPDFDDTDATGATGTDCHSAIQAALDTGRDVFLSRGNWGIRADTLSISTDSQTLSGDGWFSTRIYYAETELTESLFTTSNENITLRQVGLFNGLNVGTSTSRTNVGLTQSSNGNLGLEQVYSTGFGYGVIANNFFARRLVVENTKQVAWWTKNGRKSVLMNATMAGNRQSMLLGNGTANENLSEMSFSSIVLEHGTPLGTWATDKPACLRLEGKSYKTTWNNIHIKTPYGVAIEIDNEYIDGASTQSESGHYFTNTDITNNRTMSSATDAIDVTLSYHVGFVNLNTKQPTTGGQGWDKAVTVNDTTSFCRITNSYIGGSSESIGNDSIGGNPNQVSLANTLYNRGGTVYENAYTKEDGHRQDLGNVTGTTNLTVGEARTITMTLTGNTTISSIANNATDGDRIRFIFVQDGTGSHTLSFNSSKYVTSISGSSGTANQYLSVEFEFNSTLNKFVQVGSPSAWMT